jgi:hypothetical protein
MVDAEIDGRAVGNVEQVAKGVDHLDDVPLLHGGGKLRRLFLDQADAQRPGEARDVERLWWWRPELAVKGRDHGLLSCHTDHNARRTPPSQSRRTIPTPRCHPSPPQGRRGGGCHRGGAVDLRHGAPRFPTRDDGAAGAFVAVL